MRPDNMKHPNNRFSSETLADFEAKSQITDRTLREYELNLGIKLLEMRGSRILDIGSGVGEAFSKEAKKIGVEVVSMSPGLRHGVPVDNGITAEEFLENWQKRSVAGRAPEFPFVDNTFDYEVALYSAPLYLNIGLSDEYNTAIYDHLISEIIRTLKIGGRAYISPVYDQDRFLLQSLGKLTNRLSYKFQEYARNNLGDKETRLIITKKE